MRLTPSSSSKEWSLPCVQYCWWEGTSVIMTTSRHEGTFRITGPLWGESTGHRWIPFTKDHQYGDLMCSFWLAWTSCWTNNLVVIWNAMTLLWRHSRQWLDWSQWRWGICFLCFLAHSNIRGTSLMHSCGYCWERILFLLAWVSFSSVLSRKCWLNPDLLVLTCSVKAATGYLDKTKVWYFIYMEVLDTNSDKHSNGVHRNHILASELNHHDKCVL